MSMAHVGSLDAFEVLVISKVVVSMIAISVKLEFSPHRANDSVECPSAARIILTSAVTTWGLY